MTERDDVLKTDDADGVAKYVAAGADVNAKGKDGETALDIARENEYDEIVSLLEKAVAGEKAGE